MGKEKDIQHSPKDTSNRVPPRKKKSVQVVCLVENVKKFPEQCKLEISGGKVCILTLSLNNRSKGVLVTTIRGILNCKKVLKKLTEIAKSNSTSCQVFITFKTLNYLKPLYCKELAIFVKERELRKNQLRLGAVWTSRIHVEVELESSESEDESDSDTPSLLEDGGGSRKELVSALPTTPTERRTSQDYPNSRKLQENEGRTPIPNKEKTELKDNQNKNKTFSEPEPSEKFLEVVCISDEESSSHSDESESKRVRLSSKETTGPEVQKIPCYCGIPFDENKFHIGCSACDRWVHPPCIGMSHRQAEVLCDFLCIDCKMAT